LDLKQKWGFKDPRAEIKNCELCANDVFRDSWKETGLSPKAFDPPKFNSPMASGNGSAYAKCTPEQEALIQAITDRVLEALGKR